MARELSEQDKTNLVVGGVVAAGVAAAVGALVLWPQPAQGYPGGGKGGGYTARIVVTDKATTAPIQGASVQVDVLPSVTTDSTGLAAVSGIAAFGAHTLTVTAPGYVALISSPFTLTVDGQIFSAPLAKVGFVLATLTISVLKSGPIPAPIQGATVTLDGGSPGTTGPSGQVVFSNVSQGSHTVTASAPGYTAKSGTVSVSGPTAVFAVYLDAASFTVNLLVTDAILGTGIAGATITIDGGTPVLTDAGGNAAYSGVAAGSHSFSATATGYSPATVSANIQSQNQAVQIPLARSGSGQVLTSFTLTSPVTGVPAGGSVLFTATTKDQNVNPLPGVSVQAKQDGIPLTNPITTDASGMGRYSITFATVGTFSETATATQASTGAVLSSSPPIIITVSKPVPTRPITLATTSNIGATKADCNHKLFFAAGRFWLWYMQDGNVVYISSTDKVNWTAPTTVLSAGSGPGEMFDVFFDGQSGNVYFAWCLSTPYFIYAVGVPLPGGSVAWSTPPTQVSTPLATGIYGNNRPTIRPDSGGNIFVASETSVLAAGGSQQVHIVVYQRPLLGGATASWSMIRDYNTAQGAVDWMGILGKFTGGKMCLYYGTVNGGSTAYLEDWSGAAWGPQINLSGPARLEPMNGGGLTLGDTLYWGGFDTDSTGYIGFYRHSYGEINIPTQTQLSGPDANNYISDGQGCIASDGVTSLVVFFAGSWGFGTGVGRTTIYYRISTDLGLNWLPEAVFASGETGIQGKTLQSTDIAQTGEVQVAWTDGPAAPYRVRFATLLF